MDKNIQELFVKKFWKEESIWFYIHFQNEEAIRQIEISSKGKVFLTLENPQQGESMLYDQSIEELDLQDSDFIPKEEFEGTWNDQ
ncbi:hypothetical protein SAMN05421594_4732 [Chryseobacterium oleae]|uniref:Uncharacterized protein n=1 Tax=Chryseobacterium oleae TaxID=491207 RepID=A0A1I5CZI3_CHROL|nr:hypothetical protein [Chryseobacterium oleae]SFN92368.1 hypothetical protein SAMN05421594_4732 [Chryseobacterium oleae]